MKTAEQYFDQIKNARSSEDLFVIYMNFKEDFIDDVITLEQYMELRRACYNRKWCRL